MKKRRRILALLLATTLTLSSMPAVLAKEGTKPQDSTTKEQPFWSGTGESDKFRIPCLVSLDDGTLVAGCDARWTTHMDGGGLDTIVSYSKDKGQTWRYTFANYLGDNGNENNVNSTAFIDPAMATDGERVYMIADLYPAGYALNGAKKQPVPGKSHDDKGNILLADARNWNDVWGSERTNAANYTYRLIKNEGEDGRPTYSIQDANGKIMEGYTVDAYFNVKGENVNANLFEADSPFQVWPTDYLYLTTSEDGGRTWSVPSILNLRRDSEQSLLVGPGCGMVTSEGRIVFTAYEFTNGDKNSVAIYSDDGGRTWKRGKSVSGLSSEAVVTEADGKLYMFTRHGGYYVSNDWGETWSGRKDMGINYNLGCQLTAVTYPEKIDGKTAILFAAPSNTTTRAAGKIFVGLVQEDGTLKWTYDYSINGSDYYAYSCLTVLPDGTVGLLYENGATEIKYIGLDIKDIAKGAAIGNIWCTDDAGKTVSTVTMKSDETKTLTVNGLKENAEVTVESDNESAVEATYENGKLKLTSSKVTGLKQAVVTVKCGEADTELHVNVTDSEKYEIVNLRVGDTKTYTDKTGNYSDNKLEGLDKDIAEVILEGEDAKDEEIKPEAEIQLGTNAQFDGEKKKISSSLFTFDKKDNGKYAISATTAKGKKVYLTPKTAATANTPLTKTSADITVAKGEDGTFSFTQEAAGGAGGILYFHKEAGKLYFDRNGTMHNNCKFDIYKAAENAKDSEIPGYIKVKDLSEITDNGQYVIASKAADGRNYLLNPSQETDKYSYVAKVTGKMYEGQPTPAKTDITIKGKAEGETEVTIGKTTYYIIVKNDVKEVNLKVGETVNIPGKIVQEKGETDSISKVERNDMPPYKAITELKEGTYLFGNGTHILLNTPSSKDNPTGLAMQAANFNVGEYNESLWTIEKSENGYTMKDVNGKYVNIDNQNVTLKDTPQTLTISKRSQGGFAVSRNGYYLNNWEGANNKVAAYTGDDNAWSFYKASVGNVVTGEKAGKVTLVTEGTTYKITVEQAPVTCEHTWGDWEVIKEATCTEGGEETKTCTKCHATETRQTKALGHKFSDWEVVEEPTATEDGYEESVCERCKARQTKVLPATGENNNNGGDTGNQNNGGTAGNSGNHDNSGNSGNSGNQNQKPVKTGDMADPLTTALGMAGCLGAIIAILRRKSGK